MTSQSARAAFQDRTARAHDRLAHARSLLAAGDEQLLRTQIALCEIPAPTGLEGARAAFVRDRFATIGLERVHLDAAGNVLGWREGSADVAPIVLSAHLDSVFPEGTCVRVRRDGAQLAGAGIVDNARGLAALLALAEVIDGDRVRTGRPVLFVATVGEEGAGDLRGMKHLFAALPDRPAGCVVLDGAGDDRIVTRALGALRYRITFRGDGGHSWAAFGLPNPIHAAGAAAARIALLPLPRIPRTTLSVCRIGGGMSVNSIPEEAWLEVDARCDNAEVLQRCADEIHQAARAAAHDENQRRSPGTRPLSVVSTMIGDRPCGELPPDHPFVVMAAAATRSIGRDPELVTASTDANVPISLGVPAVTIGAGGRGGGIHTTGEWFENVGGTLGVARALTMVVAAAEC